MADTSADTKTQTNLQLGFQSTTYTSTDTSKIANTGMYIYAIKAMNGDATVASATDTNNVDIPKMAGVIITKDTILNKYLQDITFTSLTRVEIYFKAPKQ